MEIKKIRESRGMLQYELANRMGVKQASVSAWESGKAMPSAENLLKLADILECTVDGAGPHQRMRLQRTP